MTSILMIDTPNLEQVKEGFLRIINPHFDFDISDRIDIRPDVKQFKFEGDAGVWSQARGKSAHYFEVYWDNVWICDFRGSDVGAKILHSFMGGFLEAYKEKRIHLKKGFVEEAPRITREQEITAEIKKEKEKVKGKGKVDNVAAEVKVQLLEEKKKKVTNKRYKIEEYF